MTHAIIFLHVDWKPRALSRVVDVESRGAGNVATIHTVSDGGEN